MSSKLEKQQTTDAIAIVFTVVLTLPIAALGSALLALPLKWILNTYLAEVAFMMMLVLLSPLWFWLALKLRRRIDWPRNAFRAVDFERDAPETLDE